MIPTATVTRTTIPKSTTKQLFKQTECTPFEEYIKQTGMNISTEPHHRPKNIQPVPEYNQDAESVTDILVDHTNNTAKTILKNKGKHLPAPQSPPKNSTVNRTKTGNLRSPTMDMDPANTIVPTEKTTSTQQTRRIERSLLLQHPSSDETLASSRLNRVSPQMKSRTLDTLRLMQRTCDLDPCPVM